MVRPRLQPPRAQSASDAAERHYGHVPARLYEAHYGTRVRGHGVVGETLRLVAQEGVGHLGENVGGRVDGE